MTRFHHSPADEQARRAASWLLAIILLGAVAGGLIGLFLIGTVGLLLALPVGILLYVLISGDTGGPSPDR